MHAFLAAIVLPAPGSMSAGVMPKRIHQLLMRERGREQVASRGTREWYFLDRVTNGLHRASHS